jgi:predicted AAA+ superfamily ATPase
LERKDFIESIDFAFEVNPVVAILGPRQCGKTTITKKYIQAKDNFPKENYFDLERPRDRERLQTPDLTLSELTGLIVIDEIQFIPELFPILRVLVDQHERKQKYLILGSASRDLIRQSSETLAGRISYLELTPFTYQETGQMQPLWIRGGFPPSYLAKNDEISGSWRKEYIKTYLERDIPNLGIEIPPENLRRFWMMLAHYHGGILNASELGRSLGFTGKTIQKYADILTGTFMVRQLQPWFENIGKRQVKSPKIYIRDSGIFHSLIGLRTYSDLLVHPKIGASWEGFALEQVIMSLKVDQEQCFFWSTHQNAELDLLIFKDGKRLGFEFKYTTAPKFTKSMQIAMQDLKLDSLTVIYPGDLNYPLKEGIRASGLKNFLDRAYTEVNSKIGF